MKATLQGASSLAIASPTLAVGLLSLTALSACGGGEQELESLALDESTCTARASDEFDSCVATCEEENGNDASCEVAVGAEFDGRLAEIKQSLESWPERPAFIQDALDCHGEVDAQPDCADLGPQVREAVAELSVQYQLGSWVEDIAAGAGSGVCYLSRTIAKAGCYLSMPGSITQYSGEVGSRTVDNITGLSVALGDMLLSQVGCLTENAANDVSRAGCTGVGSKGADNGNFDLDVETGCHKHEEDVYTSCRGECPAPEGSSCAPEGVPSWVDCGYYHSDFLTGNVCSCVGSFARAPACRSYDLARNNPFTRTPIGTPCQLTVGERQTDAAHHFVVEKDESGFPSGGSVQCVAIDDYAIPCHAPGPQTGCPASVDY